MSRYDPQEIEKKWQQKWQESHLFRAREDSQKAKYYVLDMFPYPSGSGLHVGHLVGYTATDIVARMMRQQGYSVLHPMGWDSFGLPAEQYAIRTGTLPAETTRTNVQNFRRQLESVGYCYDWEREILTSDPSYYKWTQWIFTQLYEQGLAYQAELLVNYCPALGTVLANEEVEAGRSKEGGHPVERRPLKQWVLKITAYADRLLEDLALLDWPEGLKKLQINWIGKSSGAEIIFPLAQGEGAITTFTTRPDTLFGISYLVLSPEHPLLNQIVPASHVESVKNYQKEASRKSDLERTELIQEKTGVFTGAYALHPATGEPLPIWVADYVLMGYGTGAVMAVPAHDLRDFAFAKKYQLPLLPVIFPTDPEQRKRLLLNEICWEEEGSVMHSSGADLNLNGSSSKEAKERVVQWLETAKKGKRTIHYKLRDWLFSRQRYWGEPFPILHFADGSMRSLQLDELPLEPPAVTNYKPALNGESPLANVKSWVEVQDEKTGKPALRETNTMPQWAGSCWYYLRFCDPHNTQAAWDGSKENYWMPVDLYVGGAEHAVLHLLYARFWHKVLYDLELVSTKEPFQKLCNQGLIVARSYRKPGGGYVPPEEVEERGGKYYQRGSQEELLSQIDKMSKSKLNGVSPDEVIKEYGADVLRLYLMFLGPLEKEKVWNIEGLTGCKRFLQRFYDMVTSERVTEEPPSKEALKLGHRLLKGVQEDVKELLFNTAISKMMEFINAFTQLPKYPREILALALQMLAPFAPHMAEELWEKIGNTYSVIDAPLPKVNLAFLEDETVLYIIQVNGKVRGRFELPKDQLQEALVAKALENPQILKYVKGEIQKVIFVPNKLLNFVMQEVHE